MKNCLSLLSILLLFFVQTQADAQTKTLVRGKSITTELGPPDKHSYTVQFEKGEFAFFQLIQNGVDVTITTYDPSGEKLNLFDTPNGAHGPELFSMTSKEAGEYRIEVSPYDASEPTGAYELTLKIKQPKATTEAGQIDELFAAWSQGETPGATLAVIQDGKIIHKKAYGYANLEYDIPNDPTTVFHVASISKQFTVFAIMLLEAEGKLNLDDDIRKYVPELPDYGNKITLRHLAQHTSGLRDQWSLLTMAGWRIDDVITTDQIMKLVCNQKNVNFLPGEEFNYCNTGFTLLSEVVARVTDQSFAEFTQERIFTPLGMDRSLFYDDHEKLVKNRAYSYQYAVDRFKKRKLSYANVGATSLFTTAEDLSLWAMNFDKPKVGSKAIFDKMQTLTKLNNGEETNHGMGLFVEKYNGLREIQHGGADAGFRSYITRFPDQDFAVVIMSNHAAFNPKGVAHQIVDIFLSDVFVEEKVTMSEAEVVTEGENQIEDGEIVYEEELEPHAEESFEIVEEDWSRGVVVAPEILERYVGAYQLLPDVVMEISLEDGRLMATPTGQDPLPMEPWNDTTFIVVGVGSKIVFKPQSNGIVEVFDLEQSNKTMTAKRIVQFEPAVADLAIYSGTYSSDELETKYILKVEDGNLIATHKRLDDFQLIPSKKDHFAARVFGFRQAEFLRNDAGAIIGFQVSSGRTNNVLFEKNSE